MDRDTNIAPALRYVCTAIVLLIGVPLILIIKTAGRSEPLLAIFSMSLIGGITAGLVIALNNERAKNKVIKLPKLPTKKDPFVT